MTKNQNDSQQAPKDNDDLISATVTVAPVIAPSSDTGQLPRHPKTSQRDRNIAFGVLMLGAMCLGLGQTILFTILPPLARRIGLADIQVGMIFTVSALMWVIMSPVWGRRSDKIGRKPVILLGVGMFSVSIAGIGCILHLSLKDSLSSLSIFILLVLFRSLHGLFSSAGPAASQAYVADRTKPDERTSSLAGIAAAFGLGATLGPGIGGTTVQFGPVIPLFIVSGIAILSFLTILRFLPERSRPLQRTNQPKLKVTDKRLRAALFYGVCGGVLMVLPIQLIGFYLIDILELEEISASQVLSVVFMVSSIAALFSQLVIIQRFKLPPSLLVWIAPPTIALGQLIVALGSDIGTISFGMMITGLGTGMYFPAYNATISLRVNPEEQGAAAGLANATGAIGYIFAPVLAFGLYEISPQTPFYFSACLAVLLTVYARLVLRT